MSQTSKKPESRTDEREHAKREKKPKTNQKNKGAIATEHEASEQGLGGKRGGTRSSKKKKR